MKRPMTASERKKYPLGRFVTGYFPDGLMYLAHLSMLANDQHNPGEEMRWAREKSPDQIDCLARHLLEAGTVDNDGLLHTGKMAWRALALLQLELEQRYAEADDLYEYDPDCGCHSCSDIRDWLAPVDAEDAYGDPNKGSTGAPYRVVANSDPGDSCPCALCTGEGDPAVSPTCRLPGGPY